MAKRTFIALGQTFTATSQSAALANATYMGLIGGNATQLIDVLEILISGMASASTVGAFTFSRTTTIASTPTALAAPNSDGPENPATAALSAAPQSHVAATGGPFASALATDAKLNLSLNMFGGIIRWNAAPTQQWSILGSTAGFGESVLFNNLAGGGASGLANSHLIYEPYIWLCGILGATAAAAGLLETVGGILA